MATKIIITEEEIKKRIKGAKDTSVFTSAERLYIMKKRESQWKDRVLAYKVALLFYPNNNLLKMKLKQLKGRK